MGHNISGFIARAGELRQASARLEGARVVPLSLGFGFLPLTEQINDKNLPASSFELLVELTDLRANWAQRTSITLTLAYVETDYFGGIGSQSGIAWAEGRVMFGPIRTTTSWEEGRHVAPPLLEEAINQTVRRIGVERGSVRDEFDALGLGRHRSNESWLAEKGL
jgi:hypothetical protein